MIVWQHSTPVGDRSTIHGDVAGAFYHAKDNPPPGIGCSLSSNRLVAFFSFRLGQLDRRHLGGGGLHPHPHTRWTLSSTVGLPSSRGMSGPTTLQMPLLSDSPPVSPLRRGDRLSPHLRHLPSAVMQPPTGKRGVGGGGVGSAEPTHSLVGFGTPTTRPPPDPHQRCNHIRSPQFFFGLRLVHRELLHDCV